MPDKKINQLPIASSVATTDLLAVADPTTGDAKKATVSLLPFQPKGGTSTVIPKFNAEGVIVDSAISDNTVNMVVNGRNIFVAPASTQSTGLVLAMGSAVTSFEQQAIDITSTAGYVGIRMISSASGYSSIKLQSKNGATTLGATQLFAGPLGECVLRNSSGTIGMVPQNSGKFQVRTTTTDDNGALFTILSNGNARFDNGVTDTGYKLYVGGAIATTAAPNFGGVPEYTDNAAATTAGLLTGAVYRTGDLLKIVHA